MHQAAETVSKLKVNMNKSQDIEQLLLNPEKVPDLALSDSAARKPVFSVQPKDIRYVPTDALKALLFEQDLTNILRNRVEKIRIEEPKVALNEDRHMPLLTKWNVQLSDKISKGLLTILQDFSYKVRQSSADGEDVESFKNECLVSLRNFKTELTADLGPNKLLYGVPLKFTHLDIDKIWEEIKSTEFYDKFSEELEFLLSVSVFPFPNAMCSVWVFAGFVYSDH